MKKHKFTLQELFGGKYYGYFAECCKRDLEDWISNLTTDRLYGLNSFVVTPTSRINVLLSEYASINPLT